MNKKPIELERLNYTNSTFHIDIMYPKTKTNGISCPMCRQQLLDTNPNNILTFFPLKKNVICSNKECEYKGYRNT